MAVAVRDAHFAVVPFERVFFCGSKGIFSMLLADLLSVTNGCFPLTNRAYFNELSLPLKTNSEAASAVIWLPLPLTIIWPHAPVIVIVLAPLLIMTRLNLSHFRVVF